MSGLWGLADRWTDWVLKQFIEPVCDELASIRCAIASLQAQVELGQGAHQVSVLMLGKSDFEDEHDRPWMASRTELLMPGLRKTVEFSPQRRVLPGATIVCLGGSIVQAAIGVQVQTVWGNYDGPVVITRDFCEIGQTIAVVVRRLDEPVRD